MASGTYGYGGQQNQAPTTTVRTVTSEGRTIDVEYTFLTNPDAKVEFYTSCTLGTLFSSVNLLKVHNVASGRRRTVSHGGVNPLKLQGGEYFGVRVVANRSLTGASAGDADGAANTSVEFTKLTVNGVNMLAAAQSGRRGSDLSAAETTAAAAFSLAPSISMVAIGAAQRLNGVDVTTVAGLQEAEAADPTNGVGYTLLEYTNPLRMGLANVTIGTNSVKVPIGTSLFTPNTAANSTTAFDDSRFVLEAFDAAGALNAPLIPDAGNATFLSTPASAFRHP